MCQSPYGEGLRCHSFWVKWTCWKWNCSSRRARAHLCRELCVGRGGWSDASSGHDHWQVSSTSPAQLNEWSPRSEKKDFFFKLTFNFPTYFLQTVAALKASTSCCAQSKGRSTARMTVVQIHHHSALMPGDLTLKILRKIWEQELLLPAVQFCRWQKLFGRKQPISACFVTVVGAEGNGRRQKNAVLDSKATSFSLSHEAAMWFWWQGIWTAATHHLYKHYQPES